MLILNQYKPAYLFYFSFQKQVIMFSGRINRNLIIDGLINGKQFHIQGQGGADDGLAGIHDMKAVYTGDSPLPFSWHILASFLTYGFRPFTRYPSNIHDFFKASSPKECDISVPWSLKMVARSKQKLNLPT